MGERSDEFDRRAAQLARLPRAERFEQLMEFPTRHTIKVIGRVGGGFRAAVRAALDELGFPGVEPGQRASSGGRYVSLTVVLAVDSGAQLDAIYAALERVPGLTHLL